MPIPRQRLTDRALNSYRQAAPVQLKQVSFLKKWQNERKMKKMTEQLHADLQKDKDKAKDLVTAFILEIDSQRLLFERPFLRFFLEKGYLDVAEAFIDRTREQDSALSTEEVYQAMRNVWIMNSLQIHWNLPLALTPAVYAYSLLYPYTDNYLDNPAVSLEEKQAFNERLSHVIAGEKDHSTRVFELIGLIEEQFPRNQFPDVFDSIRFIHEAQTASMKQHQSLSDEMVLRLSFEKGGSSVLADAFLVKGSLTQEEMQFAFNYGAFLQLLDDLQDIDEDKAEERRTQFTSDKTTFDEEIRQLIGFIYKTNPSEDQSLMKDVIRSCTLMMVMEAVSRQPEAVSRKLYRELEAASPVKLSFYPKMMSFFQTTFADLEERYAMQH